MYRLTFVVLAIMTTSAYGDLIVPRHVPELDGRIVGGKDTTIEEFSYQVSVRFYNSHMCGGTIVGPRAIVTAAHCIFSTSAIKAYSVEFGSTVLGNASNVIGVERMTKHPNYNQKTIDNDIAVIVLAADIPFSASAKPIPFATESPATGTMAVVSGWGTTSEGGSASKNLQQVDLNIVDWAECKKQLDGINVVTKSMVCASGGKVGGKDACQGDSGGPLVANGKLVGVVSWGIGCGRPGSSGVYSDVAYLGDFIASNARII